MITDGLYLRILTKRALTFRNCMRLCAAQHGRKFSVKRARRGRHWLARDCYWNRVLVNRK